MKSRSVDVFRKRAVKAQRPEQEPSVCVRVGIIGCGYWGPNLIRNFHEHPASRVAAICDLDSEKLRPFAKKFPGIKLTTKYQDILTDRTLDAVIVATPISTHFDIANRAIKSGKNVLVEKPLVSKSAQGVALIRLARRERKILMVGHTFEYHPAVLKVADLIATGELGAIHYIDSIRVNLGHYQADGQNVLWDLGPHDVSIILHWVGEMPSSVSAWGRPFLKKGVEDVAFVRLEFPKGVMAHLHLSWLAPAKIRRMTVVGNKKMVIYDDLDQGEKIKIADRGAEFQHSSRELRVGYRMGDVVIPHLEVTEPLYEECRHFIDCVIHGTNPRTDGEKGLAVVRVLEAADRSMKMGGRVIAL